MRECVHAYVQATTVSVNRVRDEVRARKRERMNVRDEEEVKLSKALRDAPGCLLSHNPQDRIHVNRDLRIQPGRGRLRHHSRQILSREPPANASVRKA